MLAFSSELSWYHWAFFALAWVLWLYVRAWLRKNFGK